MRILYVVVGSAILAVGIVFEVTPKVMLIAGEGLMLVLAKLWKKPFGKVKIGFDCSLIAISLVFSLFLFGEIRGVREGTLLSALLVGFFVGKRRSDWFCFFIYLTFCYRVIFVIQLFDQWLHTLILLMQLLYCHGFDCTALALTLLFKFLHQPRLEFPRFIFCRNTWRRYRRTLQHIL